MRVLVDFSNLANITFFSSLSLAKIKPEDTPPNYQYHISIFHHRLDAFLKRFYWSELWFALDSKPQYKYDLYPKYKSGRKRLEFNPKIAIMELLKSWNANMFIAEGFEADDAIASFAAQNPGETLILSSDKDLWQLLARPQTIVYSMYNNSYITHDHLKDSFNLESFHNITLYKTLWGDPSDAVPNVLPRTKKHLLPAVNASNGSLEDFYRQVENSDIPTKCKELLEVSREKIEINSKLVKLNLDCQLSKFQAQEGLAHLS